MKLANSGSSVPTCQGFTKTKEKTKTLVQIKNLFILYLMSRPQRASVNELRMKYLLGSEVNALIALKLAFGVSADDAVG